MKVLVLGSTGMIGHKICQVLAEVDGVELFNASRSALDANTYITDFRDEAQLIELLVKVEPDIVVNAAGVLIEGSRLRPLDAALLNCLLPLRLDEISETLGFRIIQISTDCVFSGNDGPYQIGDLTDSESIYGKTKGLGELINEHHLIIRCSVIGPDLKEAGPELFSWFMRQSGTVEGFAKAIWSGVTTLELARCVARCINLDCSGLHHLSSPTTISKYELLSLIKDLSGLSVRVDKVPGYVTNKALAPEINSTFAVDKTYRELVTDLISDIVESKKYPHYSLLENL